MVVFSGRFILLMKSLDYVVDINRLVKSSREISNSINLFPTNLIFEVVI